MMFLGFNLYAWITIATVLSMFTVLLFTKLRQLHISSHHWSALRSGGRTYPYRCAAMDC